MHTAQLDCLCISRGIFVMINGRDEKLKVCGIYKITNPIGNIYVGQSINIFNRFVKGNYRKQRKIYQSFQEYGFKNHTIEILEELPRDKKILNEREKYWVKILDCFETINGLNLTTGGQGITSFSQETKQIIGLLSKGNTNCRGKVYPQEVRDKITAALKKQVQTEETIQKRRLKMIGRKFSDESKKKMSISQIGKNIPDTSSYRKFVLNTETGIFYTSAKEAYMYTQYYYHTFRKMLNGELKNETSFIYV